MEPRTSLLLVLLGLHLLSAEAAGAGFVDIQAGLAGVAFSSGAWGDADGDGDFDLVIAGDDNGVKTTRLYRNDGGDVFIPIPTPLPGLISAAVAWGDYDSDGDLDLLLVGEDTIFTHISRIYRNDGGLFDFIEPGLSEVNNCGLAWGDFDVDGDLDIGLTGHLIDGTLTAHVYRNDGGGAFADVPAGLPAVFGGELAWGDADNVGDLDILLTGETGSGALARIYRNDGNGSFSDLSAGLARRFVRRRRLGRLR